MDRTLVELAIHGDEEAYAGLMAMAGDRLVAIAYRILRDLDRAEDAVQVALVNAWRDLPTLRDPDRFEAWLTRILVRSCYAEAGRSRRWNARLRVIPIDTPSPSDPMATVADRDRLDRGFRRLPTDQRAIVVAVLLPLSVQCMPSVVSSTCASLSPVMRARMFVAYVLSTLIGAFVVRTCDAPRRL